MSTTHHFSFLYSCSDRNHILVTKLFKMFWHLCWLWFRPKAGEIFHTRQNKKLWHNMYPTSTAVRSHSSLTHPRGCVSTTQVNTWTHAGVCVSGSGGDNTTAARRNIPVPGQPRAPAHWPCSPHTTDTETILELQTIHRFSQSPG